MFKFGRGASKSNHIGSNKTDLTKKIRPSQSLRSFWINTRRYLNKNKAINWKANEEEIIHHQDQESINGHRIGLHHLFCGCMCHWMHIQVYSIIIHGLVIILGCHIMTISFMLYQGAMIWIIGRIGRFKIFVIEHAKNMKAEIVCWS